MRQRWRVWTIEEGRTVAMELDDRLTPAGCAIELQVDVDRGGRTWAFWMLSRTGDVLRVERGAQA